MKRLTTTGQINIIGPGIIATMLGAAVPTQARIDTSKPLDTSKGLYIRKSGTRVYKDPAPPRAKVYSYRGRNGTIVRHYSGPGQWAMQSKHRTRKHTPVHHGSQSRRHVATRHHH